ncbi:NUDIX domain-containing protein [Nanoarchaeota archaeon]
MKFKDWDGNFVELPEGRNFSWRPSAYAAIVNDGKVFMIKAVQHGKWELPGGGIELSESIIEGLKREVLEESGYEIVVSENDLIHFWEGYFYAKDIDKYFQTIGMFFKVKLASEFQDKSKINFKDEVLDMKWIDLNDYENDDINPIIIPVLKILKS